MELFVEQKRCLDCLVSSIEQLGGRVDVPKLEQIAELIIQTMRGPWRYFHTSEHIFEVGGSVDPIEVLAALFHDLVYVQVDQGVSFNISSALSPFVKEVRSQLVIRDETELPDDAMYELVAFSIWVYSRQGSVSVCGPKRIFEWRYCCQMFGGFFAS